MCRHIYKCWQSATSLMVFGIAAAAELFLTSEKSFCIFRNRHFFSHVSSVCMLIYMYMSALQEGSRELAMLLGWHLWLEHSPLVLRHALRGAWRLGARPHMG